MSCAVAVILADASLTTPAHAQSPCLTPPCSSSQGQQTKTRAPTQLADTWINLIFGIPSDDPTVGFTQFRDKGTTFSTSTGATGLTLGSHSSDVAVEGDSHLNMARVFHLGGAEYLSLGGYFRYDSINQTYGALPGVLPAINSGKVGTDLYTLGATVRYDNPNYYLGGVAAVDWGDGRATDYTTGGRGDFSDHGFVTAVVAGKVFETRSAALGYPRIDVGGYLSYVEQVEGAFTESLGLAWGEERETFWAIGGRAKMFWSVPDGRWTWSPFIMATLEQQFDFSHTISGTGTTTYIGDAQTFLGGQLGVDVQDKSGIQFGISGFCLESAQYEGYGGKVYVKFPLLAWAGINK